jgi:hypothetical protein
MDEHPPMRAPDGRPTVENREFVDQNSRWHAFPPTGGPPWKTEGLLTKTADGMRSPRREAHRGKPEVC